MNRAWLLAIGVVATVVVSFIGLVYAPNLQLGYLSPVEDISGIKYPVEYFGGAAQGRDVYRQLGCIYCHSQQVRPPGFGADLERGWGTRRTVARDYIWDKPHLLGSMRTGPDLINIALRQPSPEWHHIHLYEPRITSPGSIMPSFRFLYTFRKGSADQKPAGAVSLPAQASAESAYIVPSEQARQLVAYLLSLNRSYDVPEVP